MAFDQTSIKQFLKEHGKVVEFRQATTEEYDVLTGTTGQTYTSYSVYGYSMNNSPYELTNESLVIATRRIILYGKQTNGDLLPQPKINDEVIVDGFEFNVIKVFDSKSHDDVICYTLVCKG